MAKIAYLFPGQGSQAVGMGLDLYTNSSVAREVFDAADAQFGSKLSELCFNGPDDSLRETVNTQPALYVTSIAAVAVLLVAGAPAPKAVAGHSVGEYAALAAAGALTPETGLELVIQRARAMHAATVATVGTMSAVLGLAGDDVITACREAAEETGGIVEIANFNGAGQFVISGTPDAVAKAAEKASARGAKRVMPLKVSGAFHSRLMVSAAAAMRPVIERAEIRDASLPVVANLTANYETSAADIKANLIAQIDHSIQWEGTIQRLAADGFDTFVEVGSGGVLSGLIKRQVPGAKFFKAGDMAGIAEFLESV